METATTPIIKPSELRIGDIVNVRGTTVMIDSIDEYGINITADSIGVHHGAFFSDLQPIPLMPEILEKCGFEKEAYYDGNVFYIKLPDIYFYIEEGDGNNYTVVSNADYPEYVKCSIPFKYVHQLQNIYSSLTGEDLTITL